MKKALKELFKNIVGIFVIFGAFGLWTWWEVRNVRGFCDEVKPGTLVITLSAIAEAHHLNARRVRSSIFDNEKKSWFMFLPAAPTFGDVTCEIEHNKTVVLSSRMSGV